MAKFAPGQSGNPKGRPHKASTAQALRQRLSKDVDSIIATVVQAALRGDVQAAKLVLERVIPALKPQELATAIELPTAGTLTDQGRAVLGAVAAGTLPPAQGAQLLGAIAQLGRVAEIDELAARVAALENQHGNT